MYIMNQFIVSHYPPRREAVNCFVHDKYSNNVHKHFRRNQHIHHWPTVVSYFFYRYQVVKVTQG